MINPNTKKKIYGIRGSTYWKKEKVKTYIK